MNGFSDEIDVYYAMRKEACEKCMEGNWLLLFFFLASFLPFTAFLCAWLVAKHVYEPHLNYLNSLPEPVDEEEKDPLYEEKYPIEEAESRARDDDSDLDMNICKVEDTTPDGDVIMQYNKENEGFTYWSDKKNIEYKYLETVARKYVTEFRCSDIYIDREQDIKNQVEKEEKEKKMAEEREKMSAEDKEDIDSDDDVFAKLKPKQKKTTSKKSNIRAAVNANKYRYQGKLKEFIKHLEEKKEKSENTKTKKKMGFSDWKNMFSTAK